MLSFRSPVALIVFGASIVFVLSRMGREERMLVGEFGEQYREYQRDSWRLLPGVF